MWMVSRLVKKICLQIERVHADAVNVERGAECRAGRRRVGGSRCATYTSERVEVWGRSARERWGGGCRTQHEEGACTQECGAVCGAHLHLDHLEELLGRPAAGITPRHKQHVEAGERREDEPPVLLGACQSLGGRIVGEEGGVPVAQSLAGTDACSKAVQWGAWAAG